MEQKKRYRPTVKEVNELKTQLQAAISEKENVSNKLAYSRQEYRELKSEFHDLQQERLSDFERYLANKNELELILRAKDMLISDLEDKLRKLNNRSLWDIIMRR